MFNGKRVEKDEWNNEFHGSNNAIKSENYF